MTPNSTIKIALADDHILVRAGLAQIINTYAELEVKAQVGNGKELLDYVKSNSVDVVLLDLDMPVMDGKITLIELQKRFPDVKTIMLTVHQHDSFIVDMMEAGAHGYLLKDSEPDEVIMAIKTVVREGIYFNNRVSKALLGSVSKSKFGHQTIIGESLNQRELEVLALICKEKTTSQIAEDLFLSPKTIEGYRKSLLEKTGAKNVAGIAIYAVKNGLV